MQKSSKIAWTIVTLLVGGIVFYNLNVAAITGQVGIAISVVMLAIIAAIWRWESVKK